MDTEVKLKMLLLRYRQHSMQNSVSELELAGVADISVGAQELAEVADISAGAIHRVGQLSQFMHIKHFQFG